ncbi:MULTISPECIES: deoxyguanosinetriphosphate triphosphohydrolase [unclassified Roseitalea]|uniref:deoxyguanosinetriphosphate triphosphohydrolase n=1 Tax=unclassified Roseitalea TaxID=2639107 RepID=UPI00273E9509|nr:MULTISPECIES: deoxyguanosinetriphosphate triphosphohydrolase [unclassified Roseitalea]
MADTLADIGFGFGARAAFACDPARSRGRLKPEPESPTRTAFQRDRDRIIHSTAFRRLKHKTQVFLSHEGDHYRTRLTHTIEVAQIARALARAFRLDDDLAEAVALVHDFGHTPFGHTGEDALDDLMGEYGGFDHNAQALRVVTRLEQRYAEFDGLNLTWETLEGLVKHNGPLVDAGTGEPFGARALPRAIADHVARQDLQIDRHASLEAQAAAIADDIAYNTHDIDDGLRSGLLTFDMLAGVPLAGDMLARVDDRYGVLDPARRAHEVTRRVMTVMVEDVIATTRANLRRLAPSSVDDVHGAGETLVRFSNEMARCEKGLKGFLFDNLYRHEQVMAVRARAEQVVRDLFARFVVAPELMAADWGETPGQLDEAQLARRVADYIAGMTDTYALAEHRRLFDRTPELR